MAFAGRALPELLWMSLGVRHFLLPEGVDRAAFPRQPEVMAPEQAGPAPTPPERNGSRAARQQAANGEAPRSIAPRKPKARLLPLSEWPMEWQGKFSQTKKGKLAWTYWSLSHDLAQASADDAGRKKRGGVMRRFFRDLGFPAGTHTFWPASLPNPESGGELAANADVFWSGARLLGCRAAVIMGSAAARALLDEPSLKPMTAYRQAGMLAWVLWETDTLADDEDKYRRALGFMKKALTALGSSF